MTKLRRLLSVICIFCVLTAGYGNILEFAASAGTRSYTLSASDGNTYRITVSYNDASGIPENAVLGVKEIEKEDTSVYDEYGISAEDLSAGNEGGLSYGDYISKSASVLGENANSFGIARVFDITLSDPVTGTEYQPERGVNVSIEILNSDLGSFEYLRVVHFGGANGERPDVVDSSLNGGAVEFEASGFSVYVLVGEGGVPAAPRCTYTFYVMGDVGYNEYGFTDDNGNVFFKQTVKSTDELVVPNLTSYGGKAFAGWYQGSYSDTGDIVLESEPYDFKNAVITEDSAIDLYAVFADFIYVYFHDQYDEDTDSFPVAIVRRVIPSGSGTSADIRISDAAAAYSKRGGENMAFFGWSFTQVKTPGVYEDAEHNSYVITPDENGCIPVSGETHLYPIFKQVRRLTYYAAAAGSGADYVSPAKCFKGDYIASPLPVTSMKGKVFLGWYAGTMSDEVSYGSAITDPDGNLLVGADDGGAYVSDGKLYLRSDVTLYAKWADNTEADYRVAVYRQNPAGKAGDYLFVESASFRAAVGAEVSVPNEFKERVIAGYTYSRCDGAKTVDVGGETVLNVYYDKNADYTPDPDAEYVLTFDDSADDRSDDLPVDVSGLKFGDDLSGRIPAAPKSGRIGYEFDKWYLDKDCTVEFDLDRMPDCDLTVYAGWQTEWYIVTIDPNYGALYEYDDSHKLVGTGSTWFWSSYEGEPIGEYTHTTRDFVESSSGTWFYVKHDRAYNGKDRYTYYSQDIKEDTENKTFEYSPGTYTYIGWYEVNPDGTETPFKFGEHTTHYTTLRLHWKKTGVYYLAYNAGAGALESGAGETVSENAFCDYASIVVSESAAAPAGYTFVGWQVRGTGGRLFTPGEQFTLQADDSEHVSGKNIVYLDAVYARVGTASVIYDANGGTVSGAVDFGYMFDSMNNPVALTGTCDGENGTATVSGLVNNSKIRLSDGSGFVCAKGGVVYTLAGWSEKPVYRPGDTLYQLGGDCGVDRKEPLRLYAVWKAEVRFHLGVPGASWTESGYDSANDVYSVQVYFGNTVEEPAAIPVSPLADTMFYFWTETPVPAQTETSPAYDFSSPVTADLDLYARWAGPVEVPVHAIDASSAVLSERSGWTADKLLVTADPVDLTNIPAPADYAFAFAAAHKMGTDIQLISESEKIVSAYYDQSEKHLYAEYADGRRSAIEEPYEIYFVFYELKELSVVYKKMLPSGALEDAAVSASAPNSTNGRIGGYDAAAGITDPLAWYGSADTPYYAFAIGAPGATNASGMVLITSSSDSDSDRPYLTVENTWRGFRFRTSGGADPIDCGYDPQLYVIYFEKLPCVVMFYESTVGTSAVMNTPFTYDLTVKETVTTTTTVRDQKLIAGEWVNDGEPTVTTDTAENDVFVPSMPEYTQYTLKNGEARSAILFYSKTETETADNISANVRVLTVVTVESTQIARIVQAANDAFTTEADGVASYEFEYTSSALGDVRNVTFTNTHKATEVEVHVALVEDDGVTGGVVRRDGRRSADPADYRFSLALGESAVLTAKLPAAGVFNGDASIYAFGAALYGNGADNAAVSVRELGIVSVSYQQTNGNIYELVLKDENGDTLGELGSDQIYYIYYTMPKIRYVLENESGVLTDIKGCLPGTDGIIRESDSLTYSHSPISMNGKTVEQDERFEIPLSGLTLSQKGNAFRMPPILDEGVFERYLSYTKLAVGAGGIDDLSLLDVADGLELRFRVSNTTLQYSFDGTVWKDLLLSVSPTVYAVYTERGYDLQIVKTVNTTQSGANRLFTDNEFTVTLVSDSIKHVSYAAEGTGDSYVYAVPASGSAPGRIEITVRDGAHIRIKGLLRGTYTVTESGNENYDLAVRAGRIVGSTTSNLTVFDNRSVTLALDAETKLELINSPKRLCKVNDNGTERIFYTMQSAVDYVNEYFAPDQTDIEMLTDYLMPYADRVEIPQGTAIKLKTADDGFTGTGGTAHITRTASLSGAAMIDNKGTLIIDGVVIDGAEISASAPLVKNTGNLTVAEGAALINAVNIGNGGAISASSGNVTVDSGSIRNNTAANGGAIYFSGNGRITVKGNGSFSANSALSGNGGAICASAGSVVLSEFSEMRGNTAANGSGGAIYMENGTAEIKDTASVSANSANKGGAICVNRGAVSTSGSPSLVGNTASGSDGGAIWIGTGSVNMEGGAGEGNKALSGNGGFVYAENATVTVSGTTSVVNANKAGSGAAIYAGTGAVNFSNGSAANNESTSGAGGAIYAGSGDVNVTEASFTSNRSVSDKGGAVYAANGNVYISGGSMGSNTAGADGGAVYAGSGSVSADDSSEFINNTASAGKGGAVCALSGSVDITNSKLENNTAGTDGGAVYADKGTVTFTNVAAGGSSKGNTAGQNGGAVYAGSGNLTVSGGSMLSNSASAGSGGAIYAGAGVISISSTAFTENSALSGFGGAVYLNSGNLTLASVTASGNQAVNGAAVYNNVGRATLSSGSYTNNTATSGGAVGVGSKDARLMFDGGVQVKNNKLGGSTCNVYLDQDDDAVINIDSLSGSASIGIYVPDGIVSERSVPGARFAIYTNNSNVSKIVNDRFASLYVQSDTNAKKLYWGNSVKVEVRYQESFAELPPSASYTSKYTNTNYFPEFNDGAVSELASELYTKYSGSMNLTSSAVYGCAFVEGASGYGDYITKLVWDSDVSAWMTEKRDGTRSPLAGKKIIIYYSEPAYIAIENNTDKELDISDIKVNGLSVINNAVNAGFGTVFAKNGAIRSALLPITADDLKLAEGDSVNLLIPGGRNMAYTLDGSFVNGADGESIRLRKTGESEGAAALGAGGGFAQISGTTLNSSSTYKIIFGDDKRICKVVDASGVEHPYSLISSAIDAIKNGDITLAAEKTAVIEMLTDYLLPIGDVVSIPQGYNITITTAAKSGVTYKYSGEGDRAIISRDSDNGLSMINAENALVSNAVVTTLTVKNLIFDGKSVKGSSDGGGIAAKYTNVYIDNVDFKNVYASNGGALLIMFSAKDKNNKVTLPGTVLEVRNSNFTGCTSTTTETSNRLGGGALVTNAETMTLENCVFENCTAVDQAGAVFHRVDGNYNSWTNIKNCVFRNCNADAAGGLELDSKTILVEGTTFEHCYAKKRNGGGFNVWALNSGTSSADCWVTVIGCTFNDCQLTGTASNGGYGGGFRSTSVYTTVKDCTFSNSSAAYGGGFSLSNGNAKMCEIYGTTFNRCNANKQGGGVYSKALTMVIDNYTYGAGEAPASVSAGKYIRNAENNIIGRQTEITNCYAKNEGGGLFCEKDNSNSSLTITGAVITGNTSNSNGVNGGGVYANMMQKVTITGATIENNSCKGAGGGLYCYVKNTSKPSLKIIDSSISFNVSGYNYNGNGGGVFYNGSTDDVRKNMSLTVNGSSINGNTANNGSGGGVYTLAKTVEISDHTYTDESGAEKVKHSSVSDNTAKNNGGGIYHDRPISGSQMTVTNAKIKGNKVTASGQTGGGIYTNAWTAALTGSNISENTAAGNGGGVWCSGKDSVPANMMLNVKSCTFNRNTSGGSGGGIYTNVKTLYVGVSEGENPSGTVISNCTAQSNGGGICHNCELTGDAKAEATFTVESSTMENCRASGSSSLGGGLYSNVGLVSLENTAVRGNESSGSGGGIYHNYDGTTELKLNACTVTGNTASNLGGGVATKAHLHIWNDTMIRDNRLASSSAENAAGVYLINNRQLLVGSKGATEPDSSSVTDNSTAAGASSNVRLWWDNSGAKNNVKSVYVWCALNGSILVVNADKVGTQFGSSYVSKPASGFSDNDAVFRADNSTLYGIIDRTDEDGMKIIWAGPPVARITGVDDQGNEVKLYMNAAHTEEAIFDKLDNSGSETPDNISAFGVLRKTDLQLYTSGGTLYTGTHYCVKMLVENFVSEKSIKAIYTDKVQSITLTTADPADPRRESGKWTRATIARGNGVGDHSMLDVRTNIQVENIILDGTVGTPKGYTRIVNIEAEGKTVTLGQNALLQNATTTANGAGVYVNKGTLRISGGTINNCVAGMNGGGIYLLENKPNSIVFTAGTVSRCTAQAGNGGGIYAGNNFYMEGGSVTRCSAVSGGGIFIRESKSLHMSGGSVTNNDATDAGGGIAFGSSTSGLLLSKRVVVSGNRCAASTAAGNICNVELNYDSSSVIKTENGGIYSGSYIGVYVPDGALLYDEHGVEKKPFGGFASGDNVNNFYCFVNDRNGLKGGIIENPAPNTIYWIQIFSLTVSKTVESGSSVVPDPNEVFSFTVVITGDASSPGQKSAYEIDSSTGDYGEMFFESNGIDKTVARFTLKNGESITGINLSKGLTYEVMENLTADQQKKYAALTNVYSGTIGENSGRTDVDPYVSEVAAVNILPVCKITKNDGSLL